MPREPQDVHRSAASVAEDAIRKAILEGDIVPGEELREMTLAEDLGLSRTPVREALLALQASGLIETTRGRVAHVPRRSPAELLDTFELRAAVEGYAARRAADRISDSEIEDLLASCDRFAVLVDREDSRVLVRENLVFHGIIHTASRNARAPEVVRSLLEMPLLYASYAWYSQEQRLSANRQHRDIVSALARRDAPSAESLMRAHILGAGTGAVAAQEAAIAASTQAQKAVAGEDGNSDLATTVATEEET